MAKNKLGNKTIRNRQFTLNTARQFTNVLTNKFTILFSYLESIKNGLSSLSTRSFKVRLIDNKVKVVNQNDYNKALAGLNKSIGEVKQAIDKKELTVEEKQVDFSELSTKLSSLEKAINSIKIPEPKDVNFKDVVKALGAVRKQIAQIPQPKINIPKSEKVVIPSQFSMTEAKQIIAGLVDLKKTIMALPKNMPKSDFKQEAIDFTPLVEAFGSIPHPEPVEFPDTINIGNFPPTKTPQPVTNININPLRGLIHTSATTASTTLSTLPRYGVLKNRRAVIFQNLASSTDVYIGGSDVTTSNGYLLEAGSVSPAFDSGPLQVWYVITSSGTANIRCIEVANDSGQ